MSRDEEAFRKATGHESTCNCVRRWRGRLFVTRRRCNCCSQDTTHDAAMDLAIAEIGEISGETRDAIVRRRDGLLAQQEPRDA